MRFLADMGVSSSLCEELRRRGHDAIHLREIGLQCLPDDEILNLALKQGRVILTFDLDFGDLLAAGGHSLPSVVIFRLQDQTPGSTTPKLISLLQERGHELTDGAIVIIEERRYRFRRLPIER